MSYYRLVIETGKQRLFRKWMKQELKIYHSSKRKKEGWKVLDIRTRSFRLLHFGKLTIARRRYIRKVGNKTETAYLLDRELGWKKHTQIKGCVRGEIVSLLKEGMTQKAIVRSLTKNNVTLSAQTVSETLNLLKKKKSKPRKIKLPHNRIYLNLDEGHLTVRGKHQQGIEVRARVASAYTGREWDLGKKRWKLQNKQYFIEIYPAGARISRDDYVKRLKAWLKEYSSLQPNTAIFGACDGALSMKSIIASLPNSVLIASKYHVSKHWEDKWYLANNREGINNWKHPHNLGYSAESDIAKVKSKLGFGNRIYSLNNFKNLLRMEGMTVN